MRPLREIARLYGIALHRIETQEERGRIRFQRTPRRGSIIERRARLLDLLDLPLYGPSDVARFQGCSASTIRRRVTAGKLTFESCDAQGRPRISARVLAQHLAAAGAARPPFNLPPVLRETQPVLPSGPKAWLELIRIDKLQGENDARDLVPSRDARDDALDAERTVGNLAHLFRVSGWLVKEQERREFVSLRRRGEVRVGRPSELLDAPLYRASDAARFLGVSPRTVRDWAAKGRIGFHLYPGLVRRRTTPREVAICWSHHRPKRKRRKKRTLPVLGPVVPRGAKPRGSFCWAVRNQRLEPASRTGWTRHLTLRELARVFGIGNRRVERLVEAGLLPVTRTGDLGTRKARPRDLVDIPLYRLAEIGAVLGVHPSTIGRWEREGRLRMRRQPHGDHRRLSPRGLAALVLVETRRRDRNRAT